jgi:glucosamine kinase
VFWIAEAGATKTDWVRSDGIRLRLPGFNIEAEGGYKAAQKHFSAVRQAFAEAQWTWPEKLYYYGPALHSAENKEVLESILRETFPEIAYVEVAHDLLGAARAAWGRDKGIVCILGTGSNCALYDGESILRQRGGHGYLLGDEGSGADLGKNLLSALLHEEIPEDLLSVFQARYPQSPMELRKAVYQASRPSAFLAEFAYFLSEHQAHPWVHSLVKSRLEAFVRRTWQRWTLTEPIRYVGGIAQAFAPLLEEVTRSAGGNWAGIVTDPAEKLRQFHQS